jgi:hypothetical protein
VILLELSADPEGGEWGAWLVSPEIKLCSPCPCDVSVASSELELLLSIARAEARKDARWPSPFGEGTPLRLIQMGMIAHGLWVSLA